MSIDIKNENFFHILEDLFEHTNKKDTLGILRSKAWERFLKIGLDQNNAFLSKFLNYDYKFIEKKKKDIDVNPYILKQCKLSTMVFIDSYYHENLSNVSAIKDQIEILDFNQAMLKDGLFLQDVISKEINNENDSFALLNLAFLQNSIFVKIKENTKIEQPIQILHIITKDAQNSILSPRNIFFIEKCSSVKIISTLKNLDAKDLWVNQLFDFHIEDEASLSYIQHINSLNQISYFDSFRAKLKTRSNLDIINLIKCSSKIRQDYKIELLSTDAKCDFSALAIARDDNQLFSKTAILQKAEKTHAKQLFKAIAQDNSRIEIESDVYIDFSAQQSVSIQENKNLLIDDSATIISKPNMQIFADDVKAKHGSFVANINEEEMFYLKTRNIDPKAAKNILLRSFCSEIFDMLPKDLKCLI